MHTALLLARSGSDPLHGFRAVRASEGVGGVRRKNSGSVSGAGVVIVAVT